MMTYSLTYNSCGRHNSSSREYNSQLEDIFSITRVEDIILLAGKTYFLYNHNLYTNIFRTGIGLKVSSKITRVEDSFS